MPALELRLMSTFISEPGTRLGGRYRLEDRVAGASGWAAWKAIDETLARAVTVVTFAAGFPRVGEVLTAARAAAGSRTPGWRRFSTSRTTWDNAYIVMEWAAGDTLERPDRGRAGRSGGRRPDHRRGGGRHVGGPRRRASPTCASRPTRCAGPRAAGSRSPGSVSTPRCSGRRPRTRSWPTRAASGGCCTRLLTGMWPGPDYPALPTAPFTDGHPRRPRQVRAGVPAGLDDVACQAMQLTGRDGGGTLASPSQLARALLAELPPEEIPPAAAQQQPPHGRPAPGRPRPAGERDFWDETAPPTRAPSRATGVARAPPRARRPGVPGGTDRPGRGPGPGGRGRRGRGRGQAADKGGSPQPAAVHHGSTPTTGPIVLKPISAHGFDALNLSDSGNENDNQAANAIDGNPAGWTSQDYATAALGNLKAGTGLILDMGRPVKLSSVTIQFGAICGRRRADQDG